MKYTVIGYYPDNDQPFAVGVEAPDWQSALETSRSEVSKGWAVRVCAVLEGDHMCADDLDRTFLIENKED